jgi:hypothetical protein
VPAIEMFGGIICGGVAGSAQPNIEYSVLENLHKVGVIKNLSKVEIRPADSF